MITLRTPLLLLLCLAICAPFWYILVAIPQDNWQRRRCAALSHGSALGCMLKPYDATDVRACLAHQHMTIYGQDEAHHVFLEIAENLDVQQLTNTSQSRWPGFGNTTILNSGLAEIAYQPFHTTNTSIYFPLRVESTSRESPLSDEPALFRKSLFAFNKKDLGSPPTQAKVILNYFCNGLLEPTLRQTQAYCCAGYAAPNALQKLFLLAGSCSTLFYLFLFIPKGMHSRVLDDNSHWPAETQRVVAAIATLSATVIVCFVADRTALLEKSSKEVDLKTFIWLSSIIFLAGLATCCRSQSSSEPLVESKVPLPASHHFLSRQQTEEWKGWMQIVILLYHYLGLSKVLPVYQFVRLLVSAYLFMTGYGHTTYFITKNDFSLRRVASVLVRTNLLNVILAFVLGTSYDLYYFPVLTSVWFLVIWVTIPRTLEPGVNVRHYLRNIIVSAIAIRVALEGGSLIESLLNNLGSIGVGLPRVDGREFVFRFGLDAYIVHIGMAMAVVVAGSTASERLQHHNSLWIPINWSPLNSTVAITLAVLVISAYALFCRAFPSKFDYNKWHDIVSPLPVLAFLILRNSTRQLSSHHSRLFAWFGRCSLETFVLQYHMWLAADSRGGLRLGLAKRFDVPTYITIFLKVLEIVLIFAAFVLLCSATSEALSTLTRSLVNLRAEVPIIVLGLWITNLVWSISMLGQHEYYY